MLSPRTLLNVSFLLATLGATRPVAEPLAEVQAFTAASLLEARADPWNCPAVAANREHSYTRNQATSAMLTAAKKHQKKGEAWNPATAEDPHRFGNREGLAFAGCNSNSDELWEVIIRPPGISETDKGPDRVVYEASWKNVKKGTKTLTPKLCGVMRHAANRRDFVLCP